jgi:phosphatidylcholine synthase
MPIPRGIRSGRMAMTTTSPRRVALAWGVHLFTASGAVVGAFALAAVVARDFSAAALWMLVALVIDAVDGTFARAVGVSEVLPAFDGRRLDDMVDYLNYVVVPAVFMAAAGSLAGLTWTALPILASAYGFSQEDAKTEDDFFLGFPSYWNVIAIYLWLFELPPAAGTAIVAAFALLVFVPLKYIYPSKLRSWRRTTAAGAALWLAVVAVAAARPQSAVAAPLARASLAFPAWYLWLSLRLGGLHRA